MGIAVAGDDVEQGREPVDARRGVRPQPDLHPEPADLHHAVRGLLHPRGKGGTHRVEFRGELAQPGAGLVADRRTRVVHGLQQAHDIDRVDIGDRLLQCLLEIRLTVVGRPDELAGPGTEQRQIRWAYAPLRTGEQAHQRAVVCGFQNPQQTEHFHDFGQVQHRTQRGGRGRNSGVAQRLPHHAHVVVGPAEHRDLV